MVKRRMSMRRHILCGGFNDTVVAPRTLYPNKLASAAQSFW
jgi:hypothetical protein